MRGDKWVLAAIALTNVVYGQSTAKSPSFDIADVHASPHSTSNTMMMMGGGSMMTGGTQRGGRYVVHKANLVDLIRTAYGVEADHVVGGPSWLETDRFEVAAKMPPNTPPETVSRMLQNLLADRFQVVVHKDTRPLPAFVLSMGKGKPKLKEAAEGGGNPGCQPQMGGDGGPPGSIRVVCHSMTMKAFATQLRQMAGGYLNLPVVDHTGLEGRWDLEINWTARGALQAPGSEGLSIFDAVEKIGLKLESQKVEEPVIVVDSANRKPTDNPPGITQALPPPPPAEFEVADIKPSPPGAPNRGGGFQPGGRLDVHGVPLKMLIVLAWDLNPLDEIAGAPKFVDSATFDLVAKSSSLTAGPNPNGPPVEIDDLRMMLRNLLEDRFKLKVHYEDRPVNAYTLVAVKPKMKKADPSNRTSCKSGPAPPSKDSPSEPGMPLFQAVCQNITMAEFAEQLPGIAPIYIRNGVQDGTGLEGAWDFTLNFIPVPPGMMPAMGGGRKGGVRGPEGGGGVGPSDGGGMPTASDPGTAMTLFDAVNKQLGLKLEMQKRPLPVLVIDHIEEKPTDN